MKSTICAALAAAFLSSSISFLHAQAPAHSAVKAAPRSLESNWVTRAKLLDKRVETNSQTELLFIGDSITEGWEGRFATNTWAIWDKYYAKRKAVNLGIGGDRTQHVLWRLERAPFGDMKPKAAVVMIGTNNSNGEDNTPGQ